MAQNDDLERERNKKNPDANPDPITGEKGSHPIGTGVGAAAVGAGGAVAGAAAGAAIGSATTGPAAPIGGVVGAVIGAVVGGYAGKGVAEHINPTEEDTYWREHYRDRSYVKADSDYDDYGPAYKYGWESRAKYPDRQFNDVEDELQRDWDKNRGSSKLSWNEARDACCDAWGHCTKPTDARQSDDQMRPSEGI